MKLNHFYLVIANIPLHFEDHLGDPYWWAMERGNTGITPSNLHRVGVRLSQFWPEKLAVWFAQTEYSFALSGITVENIKYFYVKALKRRFAAEVKDIPIDPLTTGKYKVLKTEIIESLSDPCGKELTQILMHEAPCWQKALIVFKTFTPSNGQRHFAWFYSYYMDQPLADHLSNNRRIAASVFITLAERDDKVYELVPSSPQVASINTSTH